MRTSCGLQPSLGIGGKDKTIEHADELDHFAVLRRRVRLLMLLDGAERAGLTPIGVRRLHLYAYLSNVLAPVWNTRAFDGSVLKLSAGPFYPALQRDLDRMVGMGLVVISNLGHVKDDSDHWHLDGNFSLNRELASAALDFISRMPMERTVQLFLYEVAYAVSALEDVEFDRLPDEDPTYADPMIAYENVIDFDEWKKKNHSASATLHFRSVYGQATDGELLHMYIGHLHRRIGGE